MEQNTTTETKEVSQGTKNNQTLIIVGIAVVAIMLAGLIGYNVGRDSGRNTMHRMMDDKGGYDKKSGDQHKMEGQDHAQMTMDEMTKGLEGLTGDDFDKAFVEMMIVHHQGAVDMAKLIPANAKHAELKKLGQDIITAQTKEIQMMEGWLKSWGYQEGMMDGDGMMKGMDHSMMQAR